MKTRIQSGFTIVELLIGMIAAAVLALTAGTMLVTSYRGWIRSLALADMERDAAVAIHTLDLAVRGADDVVLTGANTLRVRLANGTVRSFSAQWSGVPSRGSLVYYRDLAAGAPMILVENRLVGFASSFTSGVVRVTMTLEGIDRNNQATGVTMGVTNMSIHTRN
jgi:prepilin-type N-terminal cleavage/methylation domain-containing protein